MKRQLFYALLLLFILIVVQSLQASIPPSSSSMYHLQSKAGADKVIYLDFDGQFVNSTSWKNNNSNFPGQPINAQASNVSELDILTIWQTVREDFMPFNVNITTDSLVYQQAVAGKRQMCIFTPTYEWCGQLGISLSGSFSYDEPCFAFTVYNKGKAAGEVASHELGHTFGLSHDGKSSPYSDYFNGQGTSPNTWSPIMGGSHSSNVTQWSKGEYLNPSNTEDDLAKIAAILSYRTDEAGNTNAAARALTVDASGLVTAASNTGIITTSSDVDVYAFTTTGGDVLLNVYGAANTMNTSGGFTAISNLDILVQLKDASNTVLATSDNQNNLTGSIRLTLAAGTYYLYIDGTGYQDPMSNGYTDYGSIGEYFISGSIASGVNQAPIVRLGDNGYYQTVNTNNYFTPRNGGPLFLASATDLDGNIVKVEFYSGSTLMYTAYNAPYEYNSFLPAVTGTYSITAKATDNSGNAGVSQTITVEVFEPHVSILAPLNLATYEESANIVINALADVHFSRYINDVKFYDGATLLTTNTSYTGPYTYTLMNATPGIHVIKVVASTSYYTNVTGEATVTVTVTPHQPGSFTASTASLCKGTSNVTYTVPLDNDATYLWSYSGNGMSIVSGDGTNSIVVSFSTSATSGTLSVAAVKNSVSSTTRDVAIEIKTIPDAPLSFTGSSTPGAGTSGNAYSVAAIAGVTYTWSYSGGGATINSSANTATIDFSTNATSGDLSVFASNACGDGASSLVSLTPSVQTGNSQTESSVTLQVMPNPSSGSFVIQAPSVAEDVRVQIMDLYGKTVYENTLPAAGRLDITILTAGTYVVKMQHPQYNGVEKIIVQ